MERFHTATNSTSTLRPCWSELVWFAHADPFYAAEGRICIREIDRLMGAGPFLIGNAVTLANLLVFPQLNYFYHSEGEEILAEYPRIRTWIAAMAARSSMKKVCAPIYDD